MELLDKPVWAWNDESNFMYGELDGFDTDPEQIYKYQIEDYWFKNISEYPPPHAVRIIGQVKLDNSPTGTKPFPSFDEYYDWRKEQCAYLHSDKYYDYFSQFRYEKMPEVGKEYEGTNMDGEIIRGELADFKLLNKDGKIIGWTETLRPIQTPTREEIIEKARQVLSEDEINILIGGNR
jgi:hypothetical protein